MICGAREARNFSGPSVRERARRGHGPIVVGSARGHAENLGCFLEGHADEVAEFNQFGFDLVLRREFIQRNSS
jgi:hypothetical protein